MGIEILVSKDSSSEEIDRAFQTIAFAYRNTIVDYVRKNKVSSVLELAKRAECKYPELIEKFVNSGNPIAPGKDLDYLIDSIDGKNKWLENMRNVQIHASILNAEPGNYGKTEEHSEIPKELDLSIRESLNKLGWFYFESTRRYLAQR